MSENDIDMRHEDLDLKEDFSGFTEVSVKDHMAPPTQLPPKIDVSEALAQAQAQSRAAESNVLTDGGDGGDGADGAYGGAYGDEEPQLPGVPRGMPPPPMIRPAPKESFWQMLLNRGLTIVLVVALGLLVWWWWSKTNNVAGPVEAAEAAVNAARKTVVEPIQKALKLPPSL